MNGSDIMMCVCICLCVGFVVCVCVRQPVCSTLSCHIYLCLFSFSSPLHFALHLSVCVKLLSVSLIHLDQNITVPFVYRSMCVCVRLFVYV